MHQDASSGESVPSSGANNFTNVSAAIPIHEEGEITEGGIEVDPERLPSTLMQGERNLSRGN